MTDRVRRGEEFWRKAIEDQGFSSLSVAAYCRRHRLKEVTFYNWRKRLRAAERSRRSSGRASVSKTAELQRVVANSGMNGSLVELVVDGAATQRLRTDASSPQRLIELSLAGGVFVRIHGPLDPNVVEQLLTVIGSVRDVEGGA